MPPCTFHGPISLTLIGVCKGNVPEAAFEVGSIQGGKVFLIDGSHVDYFPQFHPKVTGLPFGALLRADRSVIMAPDWSEELEKGLENKSVIGLNP